MKQIFILLAATVLAVGCGNGYDSVDAQEFSETLKNFGIHPEEAIVVGDTSFDIQMGRNAGTRACGVTYGNGSRESLCDADWLIDDFGKLLDIIII